MSPLLSPLETQTQSANLLTVNEVGKILKLGVRTIWRNLSQGLIPAPVRIGRTVRWRQAELDAWIAAGCPKQQN